MLDNPFIRVYNGILSDCVYRPQLCYDEQVTGCDVQHEQEYQDTEPDIIPHAPHNTAVYMCRGTAESC
jgi:hypothetical protein